MRVEISDATRLTEIRRKPISISTRPLPKRLENVSQLEAKQEIRTLPKNQRSSVGPERENRRKLFTSNTQKVLVNNSYWQNNDEEIFNEERVLGEPNAEDVGSSKSSGCAPLRCSFERSTCDFEAFNLRAQKAYLKYSCRPFSSRPERKFRRPPHGTPTL